MSVIYCQIFALQKDGKCARQYFKSKFQDLIPVSYQIADPVPALDFVQQEEDRTQDNNIILLECSAAKCALCVLLLGKRRL